MKYGYFDDSNKEYIITNPKTPVKWINYIGTLAFGGFVDQTGGAIITKGDPSLNRIVKYIPQLPNSDFKGETLYLRYKTLQGYRVFSPFFVPTLDKYDAFECHVGLGYQKIISEFYNIRSEVTIFIPKGENVVLRDIRITNISNEAIEIDVIPVIEFTHFDALKQYTNADWVPQTMIVDAETNKANQVLLRQYAFMKKNYENNFFTSNVEVDSFQTDRTKFLGDNGYGTWQNPKELQNPSLSNYEARRGDNIAALLHKLGNVQPGETKRIVTQLGQQPPEVIPSYVEKYRNCDAVDNAFDALKQYWEGYLSKMQFQTPDSALNSNVNIHNPRQCHTTFNWSRYLSLYQLGLGSRGLGFRDSSQDVMGILASEPNEGKKLIEKLLSFQKPNGSAMHQFYPLNMQADEGDSLEEDGHHYYGDDHLWIIYTVCEYIKETGDFDFLQQGITFFDKKLSVDERTSASVLEHLKLALHFTKHNTGKHGLPLLGFADWNDTVNLKGNAESVMVAFQYGVALKEMIALLRHLGDDGGAKQYEIDYQQMKEIVNNHCWDGKWYVRYFDANGNPLGSSKNSEGQIFTNAQSWAVMSGFASDERGKMALDSVNKLLNTSFGIKLSYPGYNGFDPNKGGVTTYPPGAKENGGIFLHSNPWIMIAETMYGHGDRAFEYYNQINPAAKNDIIDRYECEPYCYPQNILGDEHPQFGLARNSWLSGTSSWTYQAATKYILGIKPTFAGLMIQPCIPSHWDEFSAIRIFRNATYLIHIKNPEKLCGGVKSITINGVPHKGNVLPIYDDGAIYNVEVTIGKI